MRVQRNMEKNWVYFHSQSLEEQKALREFCEAFRLGDEIHLEYRFEPGDDKHMERVLLLTKPGRPENPTLRVKGGLVDRSDITYLANGVSCKCLDLSFVFHDQAHTGCQDIMIIYYKIVQSV